ncbi:MAG: hypothetical protein HC930_06650 [Hydrococcus sp. SU_1_0]|nr:hypothetical protein [Hydrococcus sp. SU_1_0]
MIRVKNIIGGAHSAALGWYIGTVDHALERIDNEFVYQEDGIEIQNQKGEVNVDKWFDPKAEFDPSARLWFATYNLPNSAPDEYDSEEGIGTGWHYSYLNGGERPDGRRSTVTTAFDNTNESWMRGDFAVPTLFNGNFDASFSGNLENYRTNSVRDVWSGAIAGWSYHNGRLDQFDVGSPGDPKYGVSIENVVDWGNIATLADYRQQVGYSETQPNYALKLEDGDSIVHNRFVVPDWGALRFDLHVPNPGTGAVKVFLNDRELQSSAFQGTQKGYSGITGSEYPAVDLRRFELKKEKDATETLGQSNRVGFAEQGFQTFQVDIPNEFRGKVATLKFQVDGGETVYLDNVFFKSQDLLFGSPGKLVDDSSGDYQEARKDIDTPEFKLDYSTRITEDPDTQFGDNYLLEKPQYSLSYNSNLRTPNWVGYQLDKTWLGNNNTGIDFQNDPRSPFAVKVKIVT